MAARLRRVGRAMPSDTRSTITDSGASTPSTAPTSHPPESRSSFKRLGADDEATEKWSGHYTFDPRASSETYASTTMSSEDLDGEDDDDDDPKYAVPDLPRDAFGFEPLRSTSSEFAQLFPSHRRILIRHDDTTEDGNMNLRLDTEDVDRYNHKQAFTLFHLRMYDLRNREFSLRRYSRDSGREVCHSSRKGVAPSFDARPSLQKSMSHALASLRSLSTSKHTPPGFLRRHDSGYHSDEDGADGPSARRAKRAKAMLSSNTVRLEFSNYAHVSVKRRGTRKSKRYECEYWGRLYTWKRRVAHDGAGHEISYHLVDDHGTALAHIVPIPLTPREARREDAKGSWIQPCSMWISNLKHSERRNEVAE